MDQHQRSIRTLEIWKEWKKRKKKLYETIKRSLWLSGMKKMATLHDVSQCTRDCEVGNFYTHFHLPCYAFWWEIQLEIGKREKFYPEESKKGSLLLKQNNRKCTRTEIKNYYTNFVFFVFCQFCADHVLKKGLHPLLSYLFLSIPT